MNEFESLGFFDFEDFVEELTDEQLFAINGGSCAGGAPSGGHGPTGGGSCSGGYNSGSSNPTYGGSCGGGGAITSSYPVPTTSTCGGGCQSPSYTRQNYWDSKFGPNFGKHACAATSLLNEICEQFFKEKGRNITEYEKTQAMKAAVEGGAIDQTDAYVSNWGEAATLMA